MPSITQLFICKVVDWYGSYHANEGPKVNYIPKPRPIVWVPSTEQCTYTEIYSGVIQRYTVQLYSK